MSREKLSTEVVFDLESDPQGWFAVIAGLPNVVRALCSLQHAGFCSATLVGESAERAVALFERHSIFRRDPQNGLKARVSAEIPQPGEASTLVFRAPIVFSSPAIRALAEAAGSGHVPVPDELPSGISGFLTLASSPNQRRSAGRVIRAACRKPMLQSGIASVYLLQSMAQVFNYAICRTRITPNMITIVGFLVGVAAMPLLWNGGRTEVIIAVSLLFLNNVLDQIDGQLARMKFLFSSFGDKLDHQLDEVTKVIILIPIGVGLYHATGQEIWMIMGWAGTGARLIYAGTLRYYVRFFGGANSTTTNFRFWYRVPRKDSKPKKKPASTDGIKLRFFLRKDFIHTAFFVFGVFNWLEIPFALAAVGALEYGLLSIVQLTMFHKRVGFQNQYQGDV